VRISDVGVSISELKKKHSKELYNITDNLKIISFGLSDVSEFRITKTS
jgi:hypothetical protein